MMSFNPDDYDELECLNCGRLLDPQDLEWDYGNDICNCPYCYGHRFRVCKNKESKK